MPPGPPLPNEIVVPPGTTVTFSVLYYPTVFPPSMFRFQIGLNGAPIDTPFTPVPGDNVRVEVAPGPYIDVYDIVGFAYGSPYGIPPVGWNVMPGKVVSVASSSPLGWYYTWGTTASNLSGTIRVLAQSNENWPPVLHAGRKPKASVNTRYSPINLGYFSVYCPKRPQK